MGAARHTRKRAFAKRDIYENGEGLMELGPEVKTLLETMSPMGRMATADEIAECAIWLRSDKSSFVSGHALVAGGGFVVQ
jgi:NAD(P)-dependent dehydrogenase (short-subunit alcohol dehydrogenase family)